MSGADDLAVAELPDLHKDVVTRLGTLPNFFRTAMSAPGLMTICIHLPRFVGACADPVQAAPPPPVEVKQRSGTVLVVDDEPTVRSVVAEVLEEIGLVVIEAADGIAGLRVLQSDVPVTLLVTDVGLPGGMNGRKLADAARATRPALEVVFITGYAEILVVGDGLLAPDMHVLTKPFAMSDLVKLIREILQETPVY